MARQLFSQLSNWERIKLFEPQDSRCIVTAFLSFHVQLVSDLSGADQHSPCLLDFLLRSDRQKPTSGKLRYVGTGNRVPQHALRSKNSQGLAPASQRLPPKQVKILRRGGWLTNLAIVLSSELKKTLEAGTGVFLGPRNREVKA